jgi:hypothetical protein
MPEVPNKIETDERWRLLCKKASTESDPQKLLELVREIIQLTGKEIPTNDRVSPIGSVRPRRIL